MESGDLRIFRAVAVEGTVTRAADALGYVQSNVTARVKALEKEVGTPLFQRQHGMILTPAGEKLLPYAEQVLRVLNEASYVLQNNGKPQGRLAIGTYHPVSAVDLPQILAQYHREFPGVELSFLTLPSVDLVEQILHFKLDGAFISATNFDKETLEEVWTTDQELVLIAPPSVKRIQDVFALPFLMNTAGCYKRITLEKYLRYKGIPSVRFIEFNNIDAIVNGVVAGLGASFIPRQVVAQKERIGVLRTFDVPPQFGTMRTCFVRAKGIPPSAALSKFVQMLCTVQEVPAAETLLAAPA